MPPGSLPVLPARPCSLRHNLDVYPYPVNVRLLDWLACVTGGSLSSGVEDGPRPPSRGPSSAFACCPITPTSRVTRVIRRESQSGSFTGEDFQVSAPPPARLRAVPLRNSAPLCKLDKSPPWRVRLMRGESTGVPVPGTPVVSGRVTIWLWAARQRPALAGGIPLL